MKSILKTTICIAVFSLLLTPVVIGDQGIPKPLLNGHVWAIPSIQGNNITVSVNINSGNELLQAAHVELDYDPNMLIETGFTPGTLLGTAILTEPGTSNVTSGKVIYGATRIHGNPQMQVNGTFFTVTFHIKNNIETASNVEFNVSNTMLFKLETVVLNRTPPTQIVASNGELVNLSDIVTLKNGTFKIQNYSQLNLTERLKAVHNIEDNLTNQFKPSADEAISVGCSKGYCEWKIIKGTHVPTQVSKLSPATYTGWVESDRYYENGGANHMYAYWTVPVKPFNQSDPDVQIAMFPALEDGSGDILQPVLQWAHLGWWIFAEFGPDNGPYSWGTAYPANPGDVIYGNIWQSMANPGNWIIDTTDETTGDHSSLTVQAASIQPWAYYGLESTITDHPILSCNQFSGGPFFNNTYLDALSPSWTPWVNNTGTCALGVDKQYPLLKLSLKHLAMVILIMIF